MVAHSGAEPSALASASSVAPAGSTRTTSRGKRCSRARHGSASSEAHTSSVAAVGAAVVATVLGPALASSSSMTLRRTTKAMTIRATATSTAPVRLAVTSARELLQRLAHPLELEDEVVDVAGEGAGITAPDAHLGGPGAQLVEARLVEPQLVGGR